MKTLIRNKKALFDYEILEKFEAGIILTGAEVKSLRLAQGSLKGAYLIFPDGKPLIKGFSISKYEFLNSTNYEPLREKALLLNQKEIKKLLQYENNTGLTVIPLDVYLKNGLIKVTIAVAKGRKMHDKKQVLKERSEKKRVDKIIKNFNN